MRFLPTSQVMLFLAISLIILLFVVFGLAYFKSIRPDPREQVLHLGWLLSEVNIFEVCTFLAWYDRRDCAIQTIKAGNKLVELPRKLVSVICISSESRDDLILVNVVKLIKVFIFVVVFKKLSFVWVTQIGQLLELVRMWAIRLNNWDRFRGSIRNLIF